jgi:two-component system, OmpR family, sensor histidine kinase BaeS
MRSVIKYEFNQHLHRYQQSLIQYTAEQLSHTYNKPQWDTLISNKKIWKKWISGTIKQHFDIAPSRSISSNQNKPPAPRQKIRFFLLDPQKKPFHTFNRHINILDLSYEAVRANGAIVAYIASPVKEYKPSRLDSLFLKKQLQSSLLCFLIALLLSVILAYYFSKHAVKPIDQLRTSLRKLAQGHYGNIEPFQRSHVLSSLTADINHLSSVLQSQEQLQQKWLSDIAHELRTPVSIFKAQLEALEDGVRSFNQQELQLLINKSNHLEKLICDLHTLSMSEPGSLAYRFENFDLNDFLQQSLTSWHHYLERAHITLATNISKTHFPIFADKLRLNQLFHNLMENSRRYTKQPGHVSVSAYKDDEYYIITWEDSSPGVNVIEHDVLFDRLYKANHTRQHDEGSGLGLAICKNIAHAHQGGINAEPSELGGLKIIIKLPIKHLSS